VDAYMRLRAAARRLLGRRGTFMLRNTLAAVATGLGLVDARREARPEGVTAMVLTFNEEEWVELSLKSIAPVVDEFVVIDSSSDRTPEILERLRTEQGLPIRLHRVPPGDLVEARNLGLRLARYRWVLIWDADFVAHPRLLEKIRELRETLDTRSYWLVYWPFLLFCGDIYHLCPQPLHIEHWMYTWSRKLRYKPLGRFESLVAPIYMYRVVYIEEPLGYHFRSVRRPERLYLKHLALQHPELRRLMRESLSRALEEARRLARERYGVESLHEAGLRLLEEMRKRLRPYRWEDYGLPITPEIRRNYEEKILAAVEA